MKQKWDPKDHQTDRRLLTLCGQRMQEVDCNSCLIGIGVSVTIFVHLMSAANPIWYFNNKISSSSVLKTGRQSCTI